MSMLITDTLIRVLVYFIAVGVVVPLMITQGTAWVSVLFIISFIDLIYLLRKPKLVKKS